MQNNSQQLKVRYSIESYEKLIITVEEMGKSNEVMRNNNEEMRKSNEEMRKNYEEILKRLEEDRLNDDYSRLKVA